MRLCFLTERVRDEIRMTIAAYQTLYESRSVVFSLHFFFSTDHYQTSCCIHLLASAFSVAFGMRKALMAEQGKADMEEQIKNLEEDKRQLEQQVWVYICMA